MIHALRQACWHWSAHRVSRPVVLHCNTFGWPISLRAYGSGASTRLSEPSVPVKEDVAATKSSGGPNDLFGGGAISQGGPAQTTLSAAGRILQNELQCGAVDPVTILKERVAGGNADVETIRLCLQAYKNDKVFQKARRLRKALIKSDKIGGLALDWLWKDETRWVHTLEYENGLFDNLVYFVVAEDLGHYIYDLIKVESPLGYKGKHRWRGTILRSLIRAHLQLDAIGSADDALDILFKIEDDIADAGRRVVQASPPGFTNTSLWPAVVELTSHLASPGTPHTSLEKYTKFMHNAPRYWRGKALEGQMRVGNARLALNIPGRPDPRPALELLEEWTQNTDVQDVRATLPAHKGARTAVYFLCKRLEDVLRNEKRFDEATWTSDLISKLFGSDTHEFDEYNDHGVPSRLRRPNSPALRIRKYQDYREK